MASAHSRTLKLRVITLLKELSFALLHSKTPVDHMTATNPSLGFPAFMHFYNLKNTTNLFTECNLFAFFVSKF